MNVRAISFGFLLLGSACSASLPAPINHRHDDTQCAQPPISPGSCAGSGADGGGEFPCTDDASCTKGINGRCTLDTLNGWCTCTFDQCQRDSDCKLAAEPTCACHGAPYTIYGAGNACVLGDCRIDSDCGAGGYCSPAGALDLYGYYCHTPQDTCTNDDQCGGCSAPAVPRCVFATGDHHWKCECISPPG